MHLDERRISLSLETVEFMPEGAGTRMIFTEQDAFLDGYDNAGQREQGTRDLLDNLGAALRRAEGRRRISKGAKRLGFLGRRPPGRPRCQPAECEPAPRAGARPRSPPLARARRARL